MSDYPIEDGIWAEVLPPRDAASRRPGPALFLDRDGVLVEEVGFLHRPRDVRLIAGAAAAIAAANRRAVPVVLVTNQSGIGRAMYGWADFAATQGRIGELLAGQDAGLDMVLACPFHPEGRAPYRHPDHPYRKPRPGMLAAAARRLNLELAGSWLVGDRAADIQAARAAGLAGALHVLTGHGAAERGEVEAWVAGLPAQKRFEVRLGASIRDARDLPILGRPDNPG